MSGTGLQIVPVLRHFAVFDTENIEGRKRGRPEGTGIVIGIVQHHQIAFRDDTVRRHCHAGLPDQRDQPGQPFSARGKLRIVLDVAGRHHLGRGFGIVIHESRSEKREDKFFRCHWIFPLIRITAIRGIKSIPYRNYVP